MEEAPALTEVTPPDLIKPGTFKPKNRVYKTCRAFELEELTKDGWLLVGVLPFDAIVPVTRGVADYRQPIVNHQSGYPVVTEQGRYEYGTVQDQALAHDVIFLLTMDDNDILRAKNKETDELRDFLKKSQDDLNAKNKQLVEFDKEIIVLKARRDELQVSILERRKELDIEQDIKRKLENDLAKVRKAVGDLKYKEILASPA